MNVDWVALVVVIFLFAVVTVMGFMAARWRRPADLQSLHEWGLGGKSFGTWTTWFLLGGDLYTAYTFIAVPAAMWATGAVSGFFAVPYTIVLYPVIFYFLGRMWSVAHRHGYITTADIVQGRYGTRSLSLAVAVTGILATMPYIALQLVGIQAILEVLGVGGESLLARDLPLLIAFAVLAAYTYSSGLRAPAMIAVAGLLLVGIVVPLLVGTYDRVEPRLFGFPFFYWYQLLWVFIAAGLCALSFWLLKRERDAYARTRHTTDPGYDDRSEGR